MGPENCEVLLSQGDEGGKRSFGARARSLVRIFGQLMMKSSSAQVMKVETSERGLPCSLSRNF